MSSGEFDLNCEKIRNEIIEQSEWNSEKEENKEVTLHLKKCRKCAGFAESLSLIGDGMKYNPQSDFAPRTAIRRRIIEELNRNEKSPGAKQTGILEKLKQFFSYPIPVYKASIVAALVLILLLLLYRNPIPPNGNTTLFLRDTLDTRPFYQNQLNVLNDSTVLENQNSGRSVLEDSVLAKFIVTSL